MLERKVENLIKTNRRQSSKDLLINRFINILFINIHNIDIEYNTHDRELHIRY